MTCASAEFIIVHTGVDGKKYPVGSPQRAEPQAESTAAEHRCGKDVSGASMETWRISCDIGTRETVGWKRVVRDPVRSK